MYVDKLDGVVRAAFFDPKAAEWRGEQDRITRAIEERQIANENYLEEGVHLLELARRAHGLFERREPREKRRLPNLVLSNSAWKNGELVAEFRQPFDMPYVANQTGEVVEAKPGGSGSDFENWLPKCNAFLTPISGLET
jgi:site-specific DNA recombinase